MTTIHVVTDSAALLVRPTLATHPALTILPNRLTIGDVVYREGVDISLEDAIKEIAKQPHVPSVSGPTVDDYVQIYRSLVRHTDAIVSIHMSRHLSNSFDNALEAAHQIGHEKIAVIDSGLICAAQGMLVYVALQALDKGEDFEELVRIVRGATERVYSVYYVDRLDYLSHHNIMSPSHTALGTLLDVKPFLTLEEGHIVAMEKVKTRTQAVDRLVEFVIEFTDIEDAVILQNRPGMTESARQVQDRLLAEFPDHPFPFMVYNPSMAAFIGTEATGVVILEQDLEESNGYHYED